jgi:glycosyltransferase involved in cell wall biosynthesis
MQFSDKGRVLVVTPQPFYEDRGTPIAIRYVAQALSELGVCVDILAFPIGTDVAIPRVRVLRSANPLGLTQVPIGFSWRKLALDASLWRSFSRLVRTQNYHIVHAVEEAAYMASVICPPLGQPFIYDMASAIPVELARKPIFRPGLIQGLISAAERHVISTAAGVICSSGLGEYVLRQVPDARVNQWAYPAESSRVDGDRAAAVRTELGLRPEHRVILYSGNFAAYQGIDLLLEAFSIARRSRPELALVCVGATPREMLDHGAQGSALREQQVFIVPRQPREKIPVYLKLADYLVLPRVSADNVPLKLFDYMASGKPIVATRGNAHEPLLDDTRAFLSEPNAAALSTALLTACASSARAAVVGHAAQAFAAEHFGWGRFVEFVRATYIQALRNPLREGLEPARLAL